MTDFILPFNQIDRANLPEVGGKGANLGELARAGFQVPPGFCLTTSAFARFMAGVETDIYARLEAIDPGDLETLRQAGQAVRAALAQVPLPAEVAQAAVKQWRRLGDAQAYAVRSSATAEDLPHASFAGQQDTYLNVRGQAALLEKIKACFISLFTDRAILYRMQNGFNHRQVSLSVVVQRMVLPEVAGILFTADPVTGRRDIAAIDASFGLGEALVAGLVSADLYQVDKRSGRIVKRQIAEKKLAIRPLPDGGTEQVNLGEAEGSRPALSDAQAVALAKLGSQIEAHYAAPQDIEWAMAGDQVYILQSRPITSLFPIPAAAQKMAARTGELQVMFSFGAVQGILGPITPLGQETIKGMAAGSATMFGRSDFTLETQPLLWPAAERLFINVTALVRHPVGRKVTRAVMDVIEPGMGQAMQGLWQDPRLQAGRGWFKPATFGHLARFFGPKMPRLLLTLRRPEQRRQALERQLEQMVTDLARRAVGCRTLEARLDLLEGLTRQSFSTVLPAFLPVMGGGMSMLNLLSQLAKSLPGREQQALVLTRGLPHNVTTEMDLALWRAAQSIRADPASRQQFANHEASALAGAYLAGELPPVAQQAAAGFLERYGMRGLGEIDLGRPRWREAPTPVMQVLQSYLEIDDDHMAPDHAFARGAAEAEAAIEPFQRALRQTRFGWFKARLAGFAAQRMRSLAGIRESPKFTIIRSFGIVREALLASGRDLQQAGLIDQAEDLFFLEIAELRRLAAGQAEDWRARIAARRETYDREQRRSLIPRLLLSDGHAFYDGIGAGLPQDHDGLLGNPVSPGVVEGRVHVILNPYGARLAPGEILVCPGTDPSWTPLFLAAGGLVMEVGGLMTHGSVVAREYGIPAVVGVHQATQRLQTGQRIRVDGSTGVITFLE